MNQSDVDTITELVARQLEESARQHTLVRKKQNEVILQAIKSLAERLDALERRQ